HDLLVGRAVRAALVAEVALGPIERGPAVLLAVDGALDPRHRSTPSFVSLRRDWVRCYLRPRRRWIRARSPPVSSASRLRRRVRFDGLGSSMWFMKALRRMSLPEAVVLKRLAAPRCVFIFGIGICS